MLSSCRAVLSSCRSAVTARNKEPRTANDERVHQISLERNPYNNKRRHQLANGSARRHGPAVGSIGVKESTHAEKNARNDAAAGETSDLARRVPYML